ncbi:MAG: hypothetical protein AAFZ89_01835 [Bacteroidota bacterium]
MKKQKLTKKITKSKTEKINNPHIKKLVEDVKNAKEDHVAYSSFSSWSRGD